MDVNEALAHVESSYMPIDAAHVLATEVRKQRAVLDGTAPAEGSWRTEALALRAELDRLRGVERELRIVERGLSPLCPCSSGDPNCEGPLQECPFHGDQDTFVAEVKRLRAIEQRARNLVAINEPTTRRTARVILGEST